MPPRAKFTREEIVDKAFEIVRIEGFDALTARYLGERLGSSARPIFTVFNSMDEVVEKVKLCAKKLYARYVERGLKSVPAFKGVGTQYIKFAVKEPQLFMFLFMSENDGTDTGNVLPNIDDNYAEILASVRDGYSLSENAAKKIYMHLWVYTHGIATMCATGTCKYSAEEINAMLTEIFKSLLKSVKEEISYEN